jgi:hypothetical protein
MAAIHRAQLPSLHVPRVGDRAVHLAAKSTFLVVGLMVSLTLMTWGGRGFPDQPMSFLRGPVGFVELGIIALTYASIGSFLALRLPGHAVGWCLLVIGLGVALHMPASLLVGETLQSLRPVPMPLLVFVWLLTSTFVPLAVMLIAYLLLIVPDGKLRARRWQVAAVVTLAGFVGLSVSAALDPSGLVWFPTLPNPVRVLAAGSPPLVATRLVGVALLVLGLALAASSMVGRYRCADAATRRQLRWIAGGAVVWAPSLSPLLIARYLIGVPDALGTALVMIGVLGTLAIPISIFIATTRDHLFGIDAIVSRTLVYLPLMGICGGLYAAGLALAQRVFVGLTGNTSDVAIILATLLTAAAITPARRLLESAVDQVMASARDRAGTTGAGGAGGPSVGHEYEQLTEQTALLAARLAEIEQRLSAAADPTPSDRREDAGEPGLGSQPRPAGTCIEPKTRA